MNYSLYAQNVLAGLRPRDIGDIDAVDGGEIDAVRQPTTFTRGVSEQDQLDAIQQSDAVAMSRGAAQQERVAPPPAHTDWAAEHPEQAAAMGMPVPASPAAAAPAAQPAAPQQPSGPLAPPPPQGPVIIPGGVRSSPGGEVNTLGPTQRKFLGVSDDVNAQGASQIHALRESQLVRQRLQGISDEEDAQARMVGAEAQRAEHLAKVDALEGEIRGEVNRVAKMKEDPDRLWNNKTSAQKASSFLAIALGGLLRRSDGGRNAALDQIDKEIDRDVAAQRASIESAKDKVSAMQTDFGRLVQRYGMSGAEQAYGAGQAKAVMARAQQMASQNGIADNNANLIETMTQLGANAAKREAQALKFVLPSVTQKEEVYFDQRIGGGQVPLTRKQIFELDSEVAKHGAENADKIDADKRARFVGTGPTGEGYFAPTEDEGKKDRGVLKAQQNIVPKIQKLKQAIKDLGIAGRAVKTATGGRLKSTEVVAIKSLTNQILNESRELANSSPGAMDKGLQEMMGDILGGDPTGLFANKDATLRVLDDVEQDIATKADRMKAGSSAQAAQQRMVSDGRGGVRLDPKGLPSAGAPAAQTPSSFRPIGGR